MNDNDRGSRVQTARLARMELGPGSLECVVDWLSDDGRASHDGLRSAGMDGRLFEEFYAHQDDATLAALNEENG